MERILARQLSLSKPQRYAHPSEMQKDLAGLLASYPGSVNSESPKLVVDPRRLSDAELRDIREKRWIATLLDMGVLAAICVTLLVGILIIIGLAVGK
jgi:hypothetical protein